MFVSTQVFNYSTLNELKLIYAYIYSKFKLSEKEEGESRQFFWDNTFFFTGI